MVQPCQQLLRALRPSRAPPRPHCTLTERPGAGPGEGAAQGGHRGAAGGGAGGAGQGAGRGGGASPNTGGRPGAGHRGCGWAWRQGGKWATGGPRSARAGASAVHAAALVGGRSVGGPCSSESGGCALRAHEVGKLWTKLRAFCQMLSRHEGLVHTASLRPALAPMGPHSQLGLAAMPLRHPPPLQRLCARRWPTCAASWTRAGHRWALGPHTGWHTAEGLAEGAGTDCGRG